MPPKMQPKSGNSPPSFVCTSCSKSLTSSEALRQHLRDTGHGISCTNSWCSRSFVDQTALQQHLSSAAHRKSPKTPSQGQSITAQIQPMVAQMPLNTAQAQLKPAPRLSMPAQEQPRITQTQPQLQVIPSPTTTKPLCTTCNRSFNKASALRDHLNSTGHTSKHACTACKRSFGDEGALEMHLSATKHSASASNPISKPQPTAAPAFTCTICDALFEDLDILQQHLMGHLSHWGSESSRSAGAEPLPSGSARRGHYQNTGDPTRPCNCSTCVRPLTNAQPLLQGFRSPTQLPLHPSPINKTASLPTIGGSSLKAERHLQNTVVTTSQVLSGGSSVVKPQVVTAKPPPAPWTAIPFSNIASSIAALSGKCHSYEVLLRNHYFKGPSYKKIPLGVKPPPSNVVVAISTPGPDPRVPKRAAVALDCEMVGVVGKGASEVARISAVDYLTGEVLIDALVKPMRKVTDWRTKYSGVNSKMMNAAVAAGNALNGWPEARMQLWKFVDESTILVGHALRHDLDVLGIRHEGIVDSAILAKEAIGYDFNKQWGLKRLCEQFLKIKIQNHGNKGHDSVEDTYAAREVVLWCIENEAELKAWGRKQWEALERERLQKLERKKQRDEKKRVERERQAILHGFGSSSDDEYGYDGEDYFTDDDFDMAEYLVGCGWPHPDTGYDPWSD